MVTFVGTLEASGGTTTGISVPEEVWHSLTPAKRAAVTVTIGGHSYPSTIGWYRGAFMLPVSAENRAAAGVEAGDSVEITLALDEAPRVVEAPDDLKAALAADPIAAAAWDKLAPSHRKAHIAVIEGAKAEATRARRVDKAIETLRG